MPALRDAFTAGRDQATSRSRPAEGSERQSSRSAFHDGAAWVQRILVPAIDGANAELQPERIAVRLDLNLDPRSTNHAHADFWLSETGEGQQAQGPRYSINVIDGSIWLYKTGAPGRILGTIEQFGAGDIEKLLRDATEEFGRMVG